MARVSKRRFVPSKRVLKLSWLRPVVWLTSSNGVRWSSNTPNASFWTKPTKCSTWVSKMLWTLFWRQPKTVNRCGFSRQRCRMRCVRFPAITWIIRRNSAWGKKIRRTKTSNTSIIAAVPTTVIRLWNELWTLIRAFLAWFSAAPKRTPRKLPSKWPVMVTTQMLSTATSRKMTVTE